MVKPNEARRIQFDKRERAVVLPLDIARAESAETYAETVRDILRKRGVDADATDWNYNSLTGVATRIR